MKRKSNTKRIILAFLLGIMVAISGASVLAAEESQMNVKLRIEGISQNLFYENILVPYTDELTAADVLIFADNYSESLTIVGASDGYITDINGEVAKTFGGFDGWNYKVNGENPSVGVGDYEMKDGDELLLFYGDTFGEGMQFPEADLSKLMDGKIGFKSSDTTYDEDFNPTTTINPVVGATIIWFTSEDTSTYTTDDKGEITVSKGDLTPGSHRIQIKKLSTTSSGDLFLPIVLRFAPDYSVFVEESQMNIKVRIEGINKNLFYENILVPYTDELTAAKALMFADEQFDSLTIVGASDGYITDINGEIAGTFGGFDGWNFKVNDQSPSVGVGDYVMKDGDELLLFYGDTFGVGMQFPEVDLTKILDGIIIFKSSDTTYDEDFNPTTTVNPVVGATVTWFNGTDSKTYITDSNGQIIIPKKYLTPGSHRMQIEKFGTASSENMFLPIVLRFAPDFVVTIKDESNPQTSESNLPVFYAGIALILLAFVPKAKKVTNNVK